MTRLRDEVHGSPGGDIGQLFDRHAAAVFRLAFALVHDPDTAQDVVQDTFVIAWRKRRSIRLIDGSALPWLLATARLTAMAARRKRDRRRTETVDHELLAALPSTSMTTDDETAVRMALTALTEQDRRIVELILIDGRSYAEAAAQLGLSVSAAGKRLERARARMRSELDPESNAHRCPPQLPSAHTERTV
ncbi:MAG: sigma-70 family RNA polymerase sigma factor [Pseudolysinimonas sp.]